MANQEEVRDVYGYLNKKEMHCAIVMKLNG